MVLEFSGNAESKDGTATLPTESVLIKLADCEVSDWPDSDTAVDATLVLPKI